MKKLIVLCLFFVATGLFAEDVPYRVLEFSLAVGNGIDTIMTIKALKEPNVREMNPIARITFSNDALAVMTTIGVSAVQVWAFEKLRKENKWLGYVLLVALNITKGYVIYHNIRQNKLIYGRG